MTTFEWKVDAKDSAVRLDLETVDRAFDDVVAPMEMRSSGWLCTLTIECGTFICACQ